MTANALSMKPRYWILAFTALSIANLLDELTTEYVILNNLAVEGNTRWGAMLPQVLSMNGFTMLAFAEFANRFAKELIGKDISVRFYSLFGGYEAASMFGAALSLNVATLGKAFFDKPISENTIGLLLHELPHISSKDADYMHGSHYQLEAMRLGGKAVLLARDKPELFRGESSC